MSREIKTIEDFERELRQVWLDNGWASNRANWFMVEIRSQYKQKIIKIYDTMTDVGAETEAENWQVAFANIVKQLELLK